MPKENNRLFTLLPCSPILLVEDRFDLTGSDAELVPYWAIIRATIKPYAEDLQTLISQLETLAVTLRGTAGTDYGFLRKVFEAYWTTSTTTKSYFFTKLWPRLVDHALRLKEYFPNGNLPALSTQFLASDKLYFSRQKMACLVIHQFLCTFPRPAWMTEDCSPDFHIWFSANQPHPKAASAYLSALFVYFDRTASNYFVSESERPVLYALYSREKTPDPEGDRRLGDGGVDSTAAMLPSFELVQLSEASSFGSDQMPPYDAVVISANRFVGFGKTGTQEETHVGSTPEACPVVLFTPPLRDLEILVVQDVEPVIVMSGYGRDARLDKVIEGRSPLGSAHPGRLVTMLFMDALELDGYDSSSIVPDLLPGNLERELNKAYTAFSAFAQKHSPSGWHQYPNISTGLWGCRTFGGNPEVKTIIQMCASGLSKVRLSFVLAGRGQDEGSFASEVNRFSEAARNGRWRIRDVVDSLHCLSPESDLSRSAFEFVTKQMSLKTSIGDLGPAVEEEEVDANRRSLSLNPRGRRRSSAFQRLLGKYGKSNS